ncbi:MAG: glycosyltransferase family 2 protein [Candidatus Babeliales bacterium]
MIKKKISIIIPILNEEKNLPLLWQELQKIFIAQEHTYSFELILVNDGSKDSSWQLIQKISMNYQCIAINFSRNFGYQAALTAGYDHCSSDAVITMDADLQHPPALIEKMLEHWQQGSKIVYARRLERHDSFLKKITAQAYHKILDLVAEVKIPRGISDFRLLDKQVVHEIKKYHEKARYLRGIVAWTGFNCSYVDFEQPSRKHDETRYTWSKLFKIAFDGIIGSSILPLKLAAYFGSFVIATGCIMLGIITVDALFFKGNYPLFKWLVTIIYIFLGFLFILLWLLGEYIGRMYEELKGRPLYIVQDLVKTPKKGISHESYELPAHSLEANISGSFKNGNTPY